MHVNTVIPVRLKSLRFPGKALVEIEGRPMLWYVWRQVCKARLSGDVLVATDSEEVVSMVERWGGDAVLTSPECRSGTDRIASILPQLPGDLIVNVQGDVTLTDPGLLDELIHQWHERWCDLITPVFRITSLAQLQDPNLVKVVRARDGHALYFSRSPIPYVRDKPLEEWLEASPFWGHVGIYGYQKEVLQDYSAMPESPLESAERLEQLRFLEAGFKILTIETQYASVSVDSPADLALLRQAIGH